MADLLDDIRFGVRMLVKSPAFTIVAVLSLALGIGFNTTIFSAVDSILLRPKAGFDREELVEIYLGDSSGYAYGVSSYPDYREYRDRSSVFSEITTFQSVLVRYRARDESEYLLGEVVSGNFYRALGITPLLGRPIEESDDVEPGGHPVAIVSESFWRTTLGGSADVIGQSIELNGRQYSVVGVAPPGFKGNFPGLASAFWAPAAMVDHLNPSTSSGPGRLERRTSRSWFVRARLVPGVSIEQAQAQMDTIAATLREDLPDAYGERAIKLLPSTDVRLHPMIDGALFPAASALMVVVGLVLLIACANVASMLLARASSRQGEVGIRLALGSSRLRLIRQLLTESVLLSSIGGLLGVLVAFGSTKLILALRPPIPVPIAIDLGLNARVLAFTLGISVFTGIVFGLAPALSASRSTVVQALASGRRMSESASRWSLKNALVVVQVAVSLVLLIGASLMLRSVGNAQTIDPGFETEDIFMLSTHLGLHDYGEARATVFFDEAVRRLEGLPEIEKAALADKLPLGAGVSTRTISPAGQEPERAADWPALDSSTVSPGFFEVMDIPLMQGRDFAATDGAGAGGVVILNETAARQFWPGDSAIGKRVTRERGGEGYEVVGVARDTKVRTLGEEPRPQVYFAFAQDYSAMMYFVARSRGGADAALAVGREALLDMDGALAFFEAKTMAQNLEIPLFPARMGAVLLGIFGVLALVLAAIGLYGVVAYSVSRRTREIGIRMALGARRSDVAAMVVKQGLSLVLVGCALGLSGAVFGTRVLSSVLYGISATDVGTFAVTAALLIAVAFVANWIPARRASRLEPVLALHDD